VALVDEQWVQLFPKAVASALADIGIPVGACDRDARSPRSVRIASNVDDEDDDDASIGLPIEQTRLRESRARRGAALAPAPAAAPSAIDPALPYVSIVIDRDRS